jgi:hypothetical protein
MDIRALRQRLEQMDNEIRSNLDDETYDRKVCLEWVDARLHTLIMELRREEQQS